jgi:phosphodiesterase/alkaline phosphatase D-like protein
MPKLTHGPLLGAITDNSVNIWLRAGGCAEAQIRVSTSADPLSETDAATAVATLKKEHDYTAVLSFTNLQPDTTYHYIVLLDDQPTLESNFPGQTTFRTFPQPEEEAGSFSFAFGSCFIPEVHGDEIFKNLTGENSQVDPHFFLMIGDNVYVDEHIKDRNKKDWPVTESLLELYREAYRESWKHETFRRALMQTPSFMIFDDHEFWNNWNNLAVHQHDREGSLAAKQAYWDYQDSHNPDAAERHQTADPTYHYTFSYGKDIGFFVLDCRVRRNPDAIPYPTILGEEQRYALYQWLKNNKTNYRAKFIISSVPISFIALPHKIVNLLHGTLGDQWLGYPEERLELFKFIQQEEIEGVHFLSGDIHLGQGLVIKPDQEKAGPTVYSYTSSPLANAFHLLPEQMPAWFTTLFWLVAGVLIGFLTARFLNVSSTWGLVLGLLGGAIAAWLWRKRQNRRTPKVKKKPGKIEEILYLILRFITHLYYMRKLTGVAADTIKGGNVHYVPDNLFTAVHAYNMGIVTVGIVTVDRVQEDGTTTVHFKLVDATGESLESEQKPHTV